MTILYAKIHIKKFKTRKSVDLYYFRIVFRGRKLLVSDGNPQTIDDWIAYHVKAVLLMKKNEMSPAISAFNMGQQNVLLLKLKNILIIL